MRLYVVIRDDVITKNKRRSTTFTTHHITAVQKTSDMRFGWFAVGFADFIV